MGVLADLCLVFDEPVRGMQLADIVIQSAGANEIDIGSDRTGSSLRQAADHQRVLEGAWSLTGKASQQGTLLIGQLHQTGSSEQSEGAFQQWNQQDRPHEQQSHQQGLRSQLSGIGGEARPGAHARIDLTAQ